MRSAVLVMLLATSVLFAGCKHSATKPAGGSSDSSSSSADTNEADNNKLEEGRALADRDRQQMQGALSSRIIYFDYDSADIRAEYTSIISAHARNLSSAPSLRVRLEGHSDERGSREYNIGLGERRAQAVRRALMLQGVGENQITTVSYGEERPAVQGSDESAWGKNRRVEIVYAN